MRRSTSLVWFRHDLRLDDNPALRAAIDQGGPIIPVFVWAPEEEGNWAPGSASRWWLHQSIKALMDQLRQVGSRLILRRGPTDQALLSLAQQTNARHLFWNRRYEPAVIARDGQIKTSLERAGLSVESFNAALLFEPGQILTRQQRPYQVFTPFWNACCAADAPPRPVAAPTRLDAPSHWPDSLSLDDLDLEPTIDWTGGIRATWTAGSHGAQQRLDAFLAGPVANYAALRDRPDLAGTSSLSPHLHFGEMSPRSIWHRVMESSGGQGLSRGQEVYLKEVVWREFACHLLYHFPETTDRPLRSQFTSFPWVEDTQGLRAWQRGRTGYPLVDAGMRQLWVTGWMHNRVRMVVSSFLVKHLLLPWQAGARWFWDTLVDADLANNTLGWQWIAGCGADAAPYFRIFNPTTQAEQFDPFGDYVRRWVPELGQLPSSVIHKPWTASPETLRAARVELGTIYPRPIVDHAAARVRALEAFDSLPRSAS
jgi:deoxyribodipyrimidine photo-lyase